MRINKLTSLSNHGVYYLFMAKLHWWSAAIAIRACISQYIPQNMMGCDYISMPFSDFVSKRGPWGLFQCQDVRVWEFLMWIKDDYTVKATILMGSCKKNVTPVRPQWSYVFLEITHRYSVLTTSWTWSCCKIDSLIWIRVVVGLGPSAKQ